MMDKRGKVLYVGKAGNLKNRVRSYFTKGGDERPRVQYLLARVESINVILTETEKEALILENNLIKQHKPKYNVNLRDDKSFFSLRLNLSHEFPRLTLIRTQKIKQDGARYFGPYSSARDARVTLKSIQRLFPLRQCTERQFAKCTRPCLNCQMKRCLCPCSGDVSSKEYGAMVNQVSLLLQGRSEDLIRNLKEEMQKSAEELRFEEAARIRDRLVSIERTIEAQNVSFFHLKDQDVVAVVRAQEDSELTVIQVLSFRKGNLLSGESFVIRNPALEDEELLSSAIRQYYISAASIPREILISQPIEQPELIEGWLSELRRGKVGLRVPIKGQGAKLMQLALKNAHDAVLREKLRDSLMKTLDRIAEKLNLPHQPETIEGYDISNISGSNPVGVKILFRRGFPDKSGYRIYKMRGFSNQDDPGMIHQTISRRVLHKEDDPLPDLFLIDGGKSQLNAAANALKSLLGEDSPPVVSIAKAREQAEEERFYLPNRKNPIIFSKGDSGLMLLMRVRDEAHRFAHGFVEKGISKNSIKSALDEVPGIGPKKRASLLKTFGSLRNVISATDEALSKVPGITRADIEKIRSHLKQEDVKIGLSV